MYKQKVVGRIAKYQIPLGQKFYQIPLGQFVNTVINRSPGLFISASSNIKTSFIKTGVMKETIGIPKARLFSLLTDPVPEINYDFVSGMYGIGSLICVLLYIFQHTFQEQKNITNDPAIKSEIKDSSVSETMVELVSALTGVYLVFLPFFPCLLWSLLIRSKWKRLRCEHEKSLQEKKAD